MTDSNGTSAHMISSVERQELLALALEELGFFAPRPDSIMPQAYIGAPPLSFAQERLWFIHQLEPNSPLYNIPMALRCTGRLDVAVLNRCLSEIIRRHDVLRATFKNQAGQPVQQIAPAYPVRLPIVDLRSWPEAARQAESRRLAREEALCPFDIAAGPLLRATLLRLDARDHMLLLTLHHIVADGLSFGVFMRELASLYQAFAAGVPSSLPELPFHYADFAQWQREWLERESEHEISPLRAQLAYWQQHLAGASAVLDIPTDRPRPPVQTHAGARYSSPLSTELTEGLQALSRRHKVSLFTTLLTAFQALLYRYSGQDDIVVGVPISNRNQPGLDQLIGFFINTLALRTDLSGEPSFATLVDRVGEVMRRAYDHQHLPFEKLVEVLRPERDGSRTPIFQVMFTFQSTPHEPIELPELMLIPIELPGGVAKFDLTLCVDQMDQYLGVVFEYNTDLFDETTIERMAGHFQALLRAVLARPQSPLWSLAILTEAERRQLLIDWNATAAEYPRDTTFHQLFEAHAMQAPNAVAVAFHDQQLTYGELNRQANQIAHYLRRAGIGPEALVALCMERSPKLVAGFLGILKAGGACAPLDPAYPEERLAFMLKDAQTPALLTQQSLLPGLPEHQSRVICVDRDWAAIAQEPDTNPDSGVCASNLAYIIYTSGSTGAAKGVLVPHEGLCNVLAAQVRTFGLHRQSRVLQFAALSFDASMFEISMALGAGATLCMVEKHELLPGPPLLQALRNLGVTIVTLPPSALLLLPAEELSSLRTITVAGEACPAELVAQWAGERRFFNLYGPTETTIWATTAACTDGGAKPPIGSPIANTQLYILDRYLQPLPVGVPGEIYIGGVGVARGYHRRPDLTAERFVPNPFPTTDDQRPTTDDWKSGYAGGGRWSVVGGRLYRTGDLARWLPDGQLEFLGRNDYQVKLRGFRVELGEIEAALSAHQSIQSAVVLVREEVPGEQRLEAYIVRAPGQAPTLSELRRYLRAKLPEYMVPTAFIALDALPLTPSGKIDRQALRAHARTDVEYKGDYVVPRNGTEELLAQIWSEVLRRQPIGIHDNFFDLGGHSLLATRMMSRVQAAFHVQLPLHTIFGSPTVAELAQAIGEAQRTPESEPVLHAIESGADGENDLLARLDQLSDEEVDALLSTLLTDE